MELTPTVSTLTGMAVGTDLGLQLFTIGRLAAVGPLSGDLGAVWEPEPVVDPPTDVVAGTLPRPDGIVTSLEPPWFELPQATATNRIATRRAPICGSRMARIIVQIPVRLVPVAGNLASWFAVSVRSTTSFRRAYLWPNRMCECRLSGPGPRDKQEGGELGSPPS